MTAALKSDDRQGTARFWSEPDAPAGITTTLYDLIWALQIAVPPGEEDTVVERIVSWMDAGRIRAARQVQPQQELHPLRTHGECLKAIHKEMSNVNMISESRGTAICSV